MCLRLSEFCQFSTWKLMLKLLRSASFQQFPVVPFSTMSNSVLIQKLNPLSGRIEWELQRENYDYYQEVARAGFADMLHDEERNYKYNLALQKAIRRKKESGGVAHVLDIGTGTGLLSIMAAKAQADVITACEAFHPMAQCANSVIKQNHMADRIKLIPKRSTDIVIGPNGDMSDRANILVTEVFDTELIGEGAIETFNHAHKSLLTEDSIVVPARATVFAQLVECDLALKWNRLQSIKCGTKKVHMPKEVLRCHGNGAVHDIQLAQFTSELFKPISDPVPIFHFDWNSKSSIEKISSNYIKLKPVSSGTAHAVFMWWSLDMDLDGEVILSCAPPWAHPEGSKAPWRDHWMQAIYYMPKEVKVNAAEEGMLIACRDEYSMWFDFKVSATDCGSISRPFCECYSHLALSRSRIGQLNDEKRTEKYVELLQQLIHEDTICMTFGDCCLLSCVVARLGVKKVYAIERQMHIRRLLENIVKENHLEDIIVIIDEDMKSLDIPEKVNLLLAEPVFQTSILPWHNFYFWYWKETIAHLLSETVTILPKQACIYGIAVEFDHLWKIRAPIHSTQGIDLYRFDQLIEKAIDISDAPVEPHSLWEYPCKALCKPFKIMSFDFSRSTNGSSSEIKDRITIDGNGTCNGIALWVDWHLGNDILVSTGPSSDPLVGEYVKWDIHSKQGVSFIKRPFVITEDRRQLHFHARFLPEIGEFKVNFS